tara:strand:- start:13835 stop:16663 length:2829 start_codon:yes stop_codon:yes gene_type:complete
MSSSIKNNNLQNFTETVASAQKPGTLKVIKRNGAVVPYDENKISVAITKAYLAIEGSNAAKSSRIHNIVAELTAGINKIFKEKMPSGGVLDIEYDIQNQVELSLMRKGDYEVARSYILYRAEHNKARELEQQTAAKKNKHDIKVKLESGEIAPLPEEHLLKLLKEACFDLESVNADKIFNDSVKNLYNEVPIQDVYKSMIMATRPLIEVEPNYSSVTARLLLHTLRTETLKAMDLQNDITQTEMAAVYPEYFKKFIQKGIDVELLDSKLLSFDLDKLGKAIIADKDLQFTYLGLQTLYDRYFLHTDGIRLEMPQAFFMRVAMGLALNEDNKNEKAIEFYLNLSTFDFMSSTPTLFNSGTLRSQLSSCYLTTVPDDLAGIYDAIKDNALLSKYAGGLGNDWTPVRALNAHIKGTNGKSQGVVPFIKVANDTAVAVNQGGKRKGALCAYLETWHMDIEEFLELRKNTGDERRRTHDINTANWIPDLFMERVHLDTSWTLFSPDETPDLHDLYGDAFVTKYTEYEKAAKEGKIKCFKTISAKTLWRKMLSMIFETGHPWITFKDPCNIRSPQQHAGVVHSSNLCTEITLNTSIDEIAVCNLGSVNLPQHITDDGKLDKTKLEKTITTAIRMLDNVIDINFYSVPQAENSNLKHRPIGMGVMGFQDALYKLDIPYDSQKAIDFADESMELISYYAIRASIKLSKERGSYKTYKNSLWDQGILPIDSIELLQKSRDSKFLNVDTSSTLDWNAVRKELKQHGIRNSNVLAIAPTATISNICGVSQSIEPTYKNLFVKSNLSGEFTVINPYLVNDLKELELWDNVMVNDLKYFNGSLKSITRIPNNIKAKYATAFELDPLCMIHAASRRQKWIDQGQSLNLYLEQPSGKMLDTMYKLAWTSGLKTTYYLRSKGATAVEKSTINSHELNSVQNVVSQTCSIDDPDCESCQ